MPSMRMHPDEMDIDETLVRELVDSQFPQWRDLPLELVAHSGTDNVLYRLSLEMVVRVPRTLSASLAVVQECVWLSRLAPFLTVPIPLALGTGEPTDRLPWAWSIHEWIDGENPCDDNIDVEEFTEDLIAFLAALRRIEIVGAPRARRGTSLAQQEPEVQAALTQLKTMIDVDAAERVWQEALGASEWRGDPVWIHGDLLPGNLLVKDGRLSGVIDWAGMGIGDPACDLIPIWCLLPPEARDVVRPDLEVDDATWARGRGWALSIGLIAFPYYMDSHPEFAEVARRLILESLAEG